MPPQAPLPLRYVAKNQAASAAPAQQQAAPVAKKLELQQPHEEQQDALKTESFAEIPNVTSDTEFHRDSPQVLPARAPQARVSPGTSPPLSYAKSSSASPQGAAAGDDDGLTKKDARDLTTREVAILQMQVSELARENKMLQERIREFFSPEESEQQRDGGGGIPVVNESTPVSLLTARIRRLEVALQLEMIAREELATKCEAQTLLMGKLLRQKDLSQSRQ